MSIVKLLSSDIAFSISCMIAIGTIFYLGWVLGRRKQYIEDFKEVKHE